MYTGEVVDFWANKGYGFLSRDSGGPDVFCHYSAIQASGYKKLDRGQRVQYDIEIGPKNKPQAANVQVLSE